MTAENTSNHLGFKLTPEAARRIKERIEECDLQILRDYKNLGKEDRIYAILGAAQAILLKKGESIGDCTKIATVKSWLNRSRFKNLHVFEALCEAVEESWSDVFDRNDVYKKLMAVDRKELLKDLTDSLLTEFICSDQEKNYIKTQHLELFREISGGERVEAEQLTELIRVLLKDFARNGRQLRFSIDGCSDLYKITLIKFTGKNQNEKLETWSCEYSKPSSNLIELDNWWWKGDVDIEFQALKGRKKISYSGTVSIPQQGYIWADIIFNVKSDNYELIQ